MTEALYALALLACPLGMGLMMWFMMRGGRKAPAATPPAHPSTSDAELAQLRAEVDQMRAARRDRRDDVGHRSAGAERR